MTLKDLACDRRTFVAGSALGLAVTAAHSQNGQALTWNETEAANVKLVEDFCASWSTLDLARVTAHMAVDSIYRMSETTPPVTGHEGVIGIMQPWFESSSAIEFRILETFAKGPLVINHRVDTFSSDTRPLRWEGVGVFFVVGGKIQEWSDYTIRVERG